jgi:hypothetical protein
MSDIKDLMKVFDDLHNSGWRQEIEKALTLAYNKGRAISYTKGVAYGYSERGKDLPKSYQKGRADERKRIKDFGFEELTKNPDWDTPQQETLIRILALSTKKGSK